MANLLQKASIVLTPTAYDNGKVLCAKPSEAPYWDFDFSRNSAATRVNAQGLVENVQILSSNLVQNGDFSEEGVQEISNGSFSQEGVELVTNGDFDTDSDWGLQTGWSISGGSLNAVNTNGIAFQSSLGLVIGKTYKVSLNTSNYVSGSARLKLGGSAYQNISTTDSFQEFYFIPTSNTDNIIFSYLSTFTGSIDNVSVREVGQDWEIQNGWSIGDDVAVFSGTASAYRKLYQENILTIGETYKLTFDIVSINSGSIKNFSQSNPTSYSTIGTKTEYFTATFDDLFLEPTTDADCSITNISVKEVGQNWDFGSGVSIGSNEAVFTSTPSGQSVGQNAVAAALPNGALAKVSFEVLTRTEGTFGIYFSGTLVGTLASAGVFTGYFTKGTETSFYIRALGTTSGTISNINVIQISSDTNLPRISYENFSYQDALGSEEVVNGGFDNGGFNWVNINNAAVFENSSVIFENNARIYQGVVSDLTKTYNIEINFSSISGNGIQLLIGNGNSFVIYSVSDIINNGNKITIAKTSFIGSGILFIYSQNSSTIATITNVSVKEYLGQEVVPDSGCGSWLFEPQSTNLITQSELFSDSSWAKIGTSVTSGFSSPSGNLTAFKLVENSANSIHQINVGTPANGDDYSFSVFVKKGEREFVSLVFSDLIRYLSQYTFDLTNGVITKSYSRSGVTSTFTSIYMGNGWYKLTLSSNYLSWGTNVFPRLFIENTATPPTVPSNTYQGDGTSGLYIWGAMLEQNSFSTSYIPTEGSQVTRNQDLCNNGGSLASINSTEGVLYAEFSLLSQDGITERAVQLKGAGQSCRIRFLVDGTLRWTLIGNNTTIARSLTITNTNINKVAIRYSSASASIWINGSLADTANNGMTYTSLDELTLDGFYSNTKALAVWKEALSDQELTELTTI